MAKKKLKFLRRKSHAYSKLGLRRKKKQKWRRPTGRDNKMRERRKGRPARVDIGYGSDKQGLKAIIVNNIKDLEKAKKNSKIILGKVGKKKKIGIAKFAKEKKIEISNLNVNKFLKKNEKKKKVEEKKNDKKKTENKEEKK